MTKRVENIIPPQAEAETINWATQRGLKLDVYYIIMESDAKVCVEAIHGELPFWLLIQLGWQISLRIYSLTGFQEK